MRAPAALIAVALCAGCIVPDKQLEVAEDAGVDASAADAAAVDTTPPSTTFTVTPPALDTSDTARFEFVSDDPDATFECAYDSDSYAACITPSIITAVPGGAHRFLVRAIDRAGNVDPTPALRNWTLGPIVTISDGPDPGGTSGPNVSLSFFSSAGTTRRCSVDGAPTLECFSGVTYQLSAGPHTFTVTASDGVRTASASRSWTVLCGQTVRPDSVGLFHLDEPAGGQTLDNAVTDGADAVLGSSASIEPTDPARIPGRFGGGLGFTVDAAQRASWPTGAGVLPSHTISLWVRPSATTGSAEVLFTSGDGGAVIFLSASEGGILVGYQLRADTGSLSGPSSEPIAGGVWHHVVASYDAVHNQRMLMVDAEAYGWSSNPVPPIDFSSVQLGSAGAGADSLGPTSAALDEIHLRRNPLDYGDDVLDAYCPL